jgi:polyphosphate kinase 2 (PPK2 family)
LPRPRIRKVTDDEYDDELELPAGSPALLTRRAKFRKHGLVLAFEGMDAAGKGGAIRRITHALDARQYQVVPGFGADSGRAQLSVSVALLARVPARGHIAIFDRSWYGRVLVERVRGFAAPPIGAALTTRSASSSVSCSSTT